MNDPCPECNGHVVLVLEDPVLGDQEAYTAMCDDCHWELHVPAEATARSRIGALRAIVRDHKAARIDGYIVDAFTASMLVKVYESLSPENRERFGKPDLMRLVNLGWSVVA